MTLSTLINHNKTVKALIKQLRQDLQTIDSPQDIFNLVAKVKDFGQPLKYNHNLFYIIISLLLLLTAIGCLFFTTLGMLPIGICFVLAVSLIFWVLVRKTSISDLSTELFLKKLYFDNQLFPTDFDSTALTHQLQANFNEFDRGNYQRKIEAFYQGSYQGKEHKFDYHYYKFHYVDKETKITTDADGKTRTKTVYHHYYRYGMLLDFPYVANLSLQKPGLFFNKGIYQPSSNEFNRYYKVLSDSEMTAAKFLKPMVVIAFEEIYSKFKELYFEFNNNYQLCMAYDDKDTIDYPQRHDLTNTALFLQELQQTIKPIKLQHALEHIEQLMMYSDNNFANQE